MNKTLNLASALMLAATALLLAPPSAALSAGTCPGPNGEPGVRVDLDLIGTGCVYLCTSSNALLPVGIGGLSNDETGCHGVDLCPNEPNPVVLDGSKPGCVKPYFTNCPAPYMGLPTYTTGVPGVGPTDLCIAFVVGGCPSGLGVDILVQRGENLHPVRQCL